MNVRNQIRMPAEMKRRAQAKAADLGISFTEYVRTVIVNDLSKSSSPKNRKSQRRAPAR